MIVPKYTISGVEEALAEIDRRLGLLHEGIHDTLDWFGKTTSDEMVETHTFQNRTYRLESSIGYEVTPINGAERMSVNVFANASYASQVEFGHPGPPPARPYPFFWPVFYRWEPAIYDRLQTVVEFALHDGRPYTP